MADYWRHAEGETDLMRGIGEDDATYAAGWTISGANGGRRYGLSAEI